MARPTDAHAHRAYRARRWARRHLDELLGATPPAIVVGQPIDWHAVHMDRGWAERDHLGRELATAGWGAS